MQQLFTRTLTILTLLIACSNAFAQRPLTTSRQSSYYTYIYKLNSTDVLAFYKTPEKPIDEKLLHNPVDSFRTFAYWKNTLPPGNYLRVFAEKNKLNYKLIENRSAFVKLIKNSHELRFILVDVNGNRIESAEAFLNNQIVHLDTHTRTYTAKMANRMLLKVDYAGVTNYHLLNPNSSVFTGFLSKRWFRARWAGVKKMFHKKSEYDDEYKNRERLEQLSDYSGFMVFNKPKYKPLDTVKLKAFIINKGSKKPLTAKRLLVRVQDGPGDDGKIIGYVNSYRDGGFEYSFVLNQAITDSLDMTLDDDYYVSLEDPSGIKYKLADYKGEDDDEKYLSQRKVYAASKFSYEEYELGSIKFSTRADQREHQRGIPLAVYLKATDENDLPVADGRASLTLVTSSVRQYKSSKVFVPDTLWQHKFNLDAIGETKVIIPDSIFPKADIDYNINADFWNSNNEHKTSTQYYIAYKQSNYKIQTDLIGDFLKITGLQKGVKSNFGARLYTVNTQQDTSAAINIVLPTTIPVDRAIKQYIIAIDSTSTNIFLSNWDAAPLTDGYHTADSLFISVQKTRNTPFWYWVFDDSKIIACGEADSLSYKIKHAGHSNVRVVVNYLWGGEIKSTSFSVPYPDKMLTINVKQPVSVYPGQKVKTEIEVKDARGNPVPNADITAWALTGKFDNYYPPYLPYLGKLYPYKRFRPDVSLQKAKGVGELTLNWAKWSKELGLDSIAYYQLTHPAPIYKIEEPAPDSLTQIAPFIIKNGDITPIHVLFIDENPVYFSQAEQLQRYSFAVSPGRHSLRFRTLTQSILFDSVIVHKGNKLILGITPDTLSSRLIHLTKMPDTLNRYEAALLGKYMIRVVNNFDLRMATIEQNDRLLLLNPVPGKNRHNYNEILAGPLNNKSATFSLRGEYPVPFITEPDYLYFIEPGFLKQKSVPLKNLFNKDLSAGTPVADYTQYVLTRPEADTIWQRYLDLRSHSTQLFKNEPIPWKGSGKFAISISEKVKKAPFIKNIIIYRNGEPDFIRIFTGNTTQFDRLAAGTYRLFFLLEKERYYIQNDVTIKPNGINFYEVNITPRARDSVSIKINNIIAQRTGGFTPADMETHNDALKLMEAFNAAYTNYELFPDVMQGIVVADDDGLPVPGCRVRIKGTKNEVFTSSTGKFSIKVPLSGVLMFSFLGYNEQLVPIQPGRTIRVSLSANVNMLGEVVVTGAMGVKRHSANLSYSVTSVSGTDLGGKVLLRGNRSLAASSGPLIIVDGVLVPGMGMDGIAADSIAEISTLKDAAATAIYGSEASNGVIIINTKKGKRLAAANAGLPHVVDAMALRKNFSDYAYWQPKLKTDENGKASFTTVFPDDITN
jgi:TonB-dependent SusC/RagA subfamily outer membrane receptor